MFLFILVIEENDDAPMVTSPAAKKDNKDSEMKDDSQKKEEEKKDKAQKAGVIPVTKSDSDDEYEIPEDEQVHLEIKIQEKINFQCFESYFRSKFFI